MKQKHILFDLDGTIVKSDLGITKGVPLQSLSLKQGEL